MNNNHLPSRATTTLLVGKVFENVFPTQLEKEDAKEVLEEHNNTVFEKVPQESHDKMFIIAKQDSSTDFIIGRIEYIFEENNKLLAHITLFMHGTDTVLGSTSEVGELFRLNKCTDIYVSDIVRKIHVKYINPSEDKMNRDYLNCNKTNSYFYMFNWNEEFSRFETLDNSDIVFDSKNRIQICSNCTKEDLHIKSKNPQLLDFIEECKDIYYFYNFNLCNKEYKIGSFVYLPPGFHLNTSNNVERDDVDDDDDDDDDDNDNDADDDDDDDEDVDPKIYPEYYRTKNSQHSSKEHTVDPFDIAEITSIFVRNNDKRNVRATVRLMYRPDKIAFRNDHTNDDMNMVFWSEDQFEIECCIVVGKCYVSNIINIKDPISWSAEGPDRFYFKNGYNNNENLVIPEHKLPCDARLTGCEVLVEYNYNLVDDNKKQFIPFYKKISPLRGMDLFAGCGGFTEGFQDSGSVKTKWAVEIEPYAAEAFKLNHADATVFHGDCNTFLKLALTGKTKNYKNQKIPQQGDIEIIFGGPPCQGFSGINRFSYTEKSMRLNALTATFLSFVDHYRPKMFIMENVKNFASYDGGNFLSSTIKCILKMGYQCTFTILQAGNFGVPQNRRRFILIGASPEENLPYFPEPKHIFNNKHSSLNIKFGDKIYNTNYSYKLSAPLRSVTIQDAIGDLPVIPNGGNDAILQYQKQPITSYQKNKRYPNKLFSSSILTDHICKPVSALMEGRIKLISEGEDWRYLPNIQIQLSDNSVTQILKYNHFDRKNGDAPDGSHRAVCHCATNDNNKCNKNCKQTNTLVPFSVAHTANNNNNWSGILGRLESNGFYPTITQNPDPLGKLGTVIHYDQHRISSVKEYGRAQGFHDNYKFYGPIQAKHSQIGNAVSPPMAKAIGEEIAKAIVNKSE